MACCFTHTWLLLDEGDVLTTVGGPVVIAGFDVVAAAL
jgi:hypothetical protein